MTHPIIGWKGCAALGFYIGFFYYLSRSYTGPWTSKYDMPRKAYEEYKDLSPEFAAKFAPDSHPALRKEV